MWFPTSPPSVADIAIWCITMVSAYPLILSDQTVSGPESMFVLWQFAMPFIAMGRTIRADRRAQKKIAAASSLSASTEAYLEPHIQGGGLTWAALNHTPGETLSVDACWAICVQLGLDPSDVFAAAEVPLLGESRDARVD